MAAAEEGEDPFLAPFQDEYDSFFANEASAATPARPGSESADIEREYEVLSSYAPGAVPNGAAASERQQESPGSGAATFSMADDDDEEPAEMEMVHSGYQQDLCLPELPPAPEGFTEGDLRLREALAAFYTKRCAERLPSVNSIVERYRGRGAATLWAQLALKYELPAPEAVELLAGTLYGEAAYEHGDAEAATALEAQLQAPVPRLVSRALEAGAEELVRALCFRGLPEEELRPRFWKLMLKVLPAGRQGDWEVVEREQRAAYAAQRGELLVVTAAQKMEVKLDAHQAMRALEGLQQIVKDVERTRQEEPLFQKASVRAELSALLFVFAQRNGCGLQYVQGMNEVAALLYSVFAAHGPPEHAEADAFCCFSALMREMRAARDSILGEEGMQAGMPAAVASVERLLKAYDPELSKHLQRSECPLSVYTFRWCSLLFAQEASLPEAVCLFEAVLAEPQRFDFVVHLCIATLLARREELLALHEAGAMADALRAAPREAGAARLLQLARAVCAFERRPQTPPFPVRSAVQLVQDFSGWAQRLGAGVARSLQTNCPPAVKDKAGQAVGTAAAAAQGGAQAVKDWLEQPAPLQPETIEKATAQVASLWQAVRTKGAQAVSRGKDLVNEPQRQA